MIKFYVQPWRSDATITRVEVARETDAFVVLEGQYRDRPGKWTRREKKEGAYFDNWKEAHEFLLRTASDRLGTASDRLESANMQARDAMKRLDRVHAMKEDEAQ